jgi:hypothetical protein
MRWRLILEEFGPEIIHIKGEDNIAADAISRIPTYQGSEMLSEMEHLILEDEESFPLNLPLVQKAQQQELNKTNNKLKQIVKDKKSGCNKMILDGVELITYEDRIYVPVKLRKRTLEWYHHFLNHPGVERLFKTINKVCYWKGMASQNAGPAKIINQEKESMVMSLRRMWKKNSFHGVPYIRT